MRLPTARTIQSRLTWLDKVGDPATLARTARELMEKADQGAGSNYHRAMLMLGYLDTLFQTHGTERIRNRHERTSLIYLNTGDTYTPTVIYNTETETILITSWGDIVERRPSYYP